MGESTSRVAFLMATVGVAVLTAFFLAFTVRAWLRSFQLKSKVRFKTQNVLANLSPRAEDAQQELELKLVRAGLSGPQGQELFATVRLILFLGAAFLGVLVWLSQDSLTYSLILTGLLVIIAFLGPRYWLDLKIRTRQQLIVRALPPTIDLVQLCLEGGLSVEQAFERTTAELETIEPEMAEEFSLMVAEMAAGLTFAQALRRMAERIGIEELSMLSGVISQATTLGASILGTFREYTAASRDRRVLQLEERAGKMSAAMTLPLVLCLLPAALVIVVGPAAVMIARAFGDM